MKNEDVPVSQPLADNMQRLRGERAIGVLRQEMAGEGVQIGTSTLHRADKGELGIRVESLEKIGKFFDVSAAQLLQPELGNSGWLLTGIISPKDWRRIDPDVRKDILAMVAAVVDRHRPAETGAGKSLSSQSGDDQRNTG